MKLLVIRLSSLGDILLAFSFLENLPEGAEVDWVVRSEFAFALAGHPRIKTLIPFSKRAGLAGWIKLVLALSKNSYDARVDLHRNLRSSLAFCLLRILDLLRFRFTKHLRVSKERLRTNLYFLLKEWTPAQFRPRPYWFRFGTLGLKLKSSAQLIPSPPSYLPVLSASRLNETDVLQKYDLSAKTFFVMMPAASFRTKEWSPKRYFELSQSAELKDMVPVIVGREADHACRALRDEFKKHGIAYRDALSEIDFKITAILLKNAKLYVGSDTGLAHLSEAVGTRSIVIYGPTRPGLGFGPWRSESKSVALPLACAPCSKDGKLCVRFTSPYACLKDLDLERVRKAFQ